MDGEGKKKNAEPSASAALQLDALARFPVLSSREHREIDGHLGLGLGWDVRFT